MKLGLAAVRWLRDPDHDRLRWAVALSRGHEGGSDADDEQLAEAILSRLEHFAETETESEPEEPYRPIGAEQLNGFGGVR